MITFATVWLVMFVTSHGVHDGEDDISAYKRAHDHAHDPELKLFMNLLSAALSASAGIKE